VTGGDKHFPWTHAICGLKWPHFYVMNIKTFKFTYEIVFRWRGVEYGSVFVAICREYIFCPMRGCERMIASYNGIY
jgi:hypothetical protein